MVTKFLSDSLKQTYILMHEIQLQHGLITLFVWMCVVVYHHWKLIIYFNVLLGIVICLALLIKFCSDSLKVIFILMQDSANRCNFSSASLLLSDWCSCFSTLYFYVLIRLCGPSFFVAKFFSNSLLVILAMMQDMQKCSFSKNEYFPWTNTIVCQQSKLIPYIYLTVTYYYASWIDVDVHWLEWSTL
jgi:hypothetical protein